MKVVHSEKDVKLTPAEFKGVPDSSGKMWPFGSVQAENVLIDCERQRQIRAKRRREARAEKTD